MNTVAPDRPEPDAAARELSRRLGERLAAAIEAAGGALPFDRYMESALYEPGLGYYSNGLAKFGRGGDFVTAPELGDLFARCLARCLAPVLRDTGGELLELGAGSGALAVDLLRALQALDALPKQYFILERSGALRARQEARLAKAGAPVPVRWLERLPGPGFRGVIFGNEVADALPVKRFRWTGSDVVELGVGCAAGRLRDTELASPDARLAEAVMSWAGHVEWPRGYESEWCPQLEAWLAALAAPLERGLVLLIDYGDGRPALWHPARARGTLKCHYRHRVHDDPLWMPGLQDITASVDFTRLADAGTNAGLRLAGYTTQAHFLLDCGIEQCLSETPADGGARWFSRVAEMKTLVMPDEMGERIKVMALTRGVEAPPGFGGRDLRGGL